MKRVLLIHDLEGNILAVKTEGNGTNEPVGVPFLWINLKENQFIDINKKVDVSNELNPFEVSDIPPSEVESLREEFNNAMLEISMLMAMGGNGIV